MVPCASVSSEVENTVCTQPSTCLTCWPWCYNVQPCHRMTSVTHRSLSSLPLQPTILLLHLLLLLTPRWHKSHSARLPSFCLLSALTFELLSLRHGLFYFYFFFLTTLQSPLTILLIRSSLCFFLFIFFPASVSHSSAPVPRPTLVGLGGQQAMTVVLAVDFEVTFAQPHWDSATVSETKREEDGAGVNRKYWKTERGGRIYIHIHAHWPKH